MLDFAARAGARRFIAWFAMPLAVLLAVSMQAALADPPARVGRVSFLSGTVSFFADPDEGWRPAVINYPVTSENSLWTERNARSEVQIGATAIGIDQESVLDFQRLSDDATLAYLQRGAMSVRMRDADARDVYRIATPQGQFTLSANGRYRIEADDATGESRITVFQGRARADVQGGATQVDAGHALSVAADGRAAFEDIALTDFDDWNEARDQRSVAAAADGVQYVSAAMTGYEDLGRYGQWDDAPEYGAVWYPTAVATTWVPYRYGHWAWVRPWGWTWIDDAAWGFAPFHYGRWVLVRERWAWWPGAFVRRPVYAPALVAWFGRPGAAGVGPGIGWCPLGPRETFYPHYTNNAAYLRSVNNFGAGRPLQPRPEGSYVNQRPGATFVAPQVFTTAAPVAPNHSRVSPEIVATLPVTQNPSLLPARASTPVGLRGRGPVLSTPAAVVPPRDPAGVASAAATPFHANAGRPAVAPVAAPAPAAVPVTSVPPATADRTPYHAPAQPRLAKPLQVPVPAEPQAPAVSPFSTAAPAPAASVPIGRARTHPVPQYQVDEAPVRPVPPPHVAAPVPRPAPIPQNVEQVPQQPRYRVPLQSVPQYVVPQPAPGAPRTAVPGQPVPPGQAQPQQQPRGEEREQQPARVREHDR